MVSATGHDRRTMKNRTDPKIEELRALRGFAGASDKELGALARLVDRVEVSAGDLLTREGTSGYECFVIIEGRAEVTVHGEAVNTIGPGEFVGEMALLEAQPRSATVRAVTPISAFVIDARRFGSFSEDRHVSRAMLKSFAERLRHVDETAAGYVTG
jgi:CRP-like cAMP-binding protein